MLLCKIDALFTYLRNKSSGPKIFKVRQNKKNVKNASGNAPPTTIASVMKVPSVPQLLGPSVYKVSILLNYFFLFPMQDLSIMRQNFDPF
jgi:hypothetical protein